MSDQRISEEQVARIEEEKAALLKVRTNLKAGVEAKIQPLYGVTPAMPLYGIKLMPLYGIALYGIQT